TPSRRELDELADRIEARPSAWVGQAQLALASVPTLTDTGLEARRAVLRTFCVARDDSYLAMTGGLTRVATSHQAVISSQTGALSKDTWVLASEPEKMTGLWLDSGRVVAAVAPEGSMSSRAAENLFWLGRYAERAEGTVRLMRVVHDRRNDFAHDTNPTGKACLHAALLRSTVTVEHDPATESLLLESVLTTAESIITYRRRYRSHAHLATMLDLLLLDPDNPRSLAHQLDLLLEDVRALPAGPG